MAKVIITLEDKEDGLVGIHVVYEPIFEPSVEITNSQYAAFTVLNVLLETNELNGKIEAE